MAKDKLSANPVQAQRKAEKARALKKGKAQLQAQRNEKLARRNPQRLQRQIDNLRSAEATGSLRPKDRETLSQLERDLRAVYKAREALGDNAPHFKQPLDDSKRSSRPSGAGVLGKRRRGGALNTDSSETDEDVREIPMPRDTPPPIPRRNNDRYSSELQQEAPEGPHPLPPKPQVEAKTVYSSAPIIRDLRQEAVSKFIPSSVKVKQKAKTSSSTMHQAALKDVEKAVDAASAEAEHRLMAAEQDLANSGANKEANTLPVDLAAEEERFEREMRQVEIEEVQDDDT